MSPKFTKIKVLTIQLMFLAIALAGCSNQWREANFDVDYTEVEGLLTEIQTSLEGSQSGAKDTFFSLLEDPNATVYYATANGMDMERTPFGTVANVFSIARYDFLGDMFNGLGIWDVQNVSVVFVYLPTDSGDECALLVDLTLIETQQATSRFFACDAAGVDGGEFVAELSDINGRRIVLRSFDVTSDGFLKDVIQLKVSDFDPNNREEQPNGKFSTLVGFGP
jgi:hypothetical protein